MNHFNSAQNDRCRAEGLEAQHWPNATFDSSVVLLNDVVEIFALANFDLGLVLGIVGVDGGSIRAALIDRDHARKAMTLDGTSKKAQCGLAITLGGDQEVHG